MTIEDVAVLELLSSTPGGSAYSYEINENGEISAIKRDIHEEEKNLIEYIVQIQDGIILGVKYILQFCKTHGLNSYHLKILAKEAVKELMSNPDPIISDIFFKHYHNEEFGAGEIQFLGEHIAPMKESIKKGKIETYFTLYKAFKNTRWPSGFVVNPFVIDFIKSLPKAEKIKIPAVFYKKYFYINKGIGSFPKIAFYVPAPMRASGGHRTIFNIAKRLIDLDTEVYIYCEGPGEGIGVVEEYFEGKPAKIYIGWDIYPPFDFAIATVGYSAEKVASSEHSRFRGYLVQDLEMYFNPISDMFISIENSYSLGLIHFTIGNFLSHYIRKTYKGFCIPTGPGLGVDLNTYRLDQNIQRENAICILWQPEKFRRLPIFCAEVMRYLKRNFPELTIYTFGSNSKPPSDIDAVHLGVIHNLKELSELYNKCKVVFCPSPTNPSRIPFEAMACGCVPVDLYRYNNLFDYPNEASLLAYQDVESICHAITYALDKWDILSKNATSFAEKRPLEREIDIIVNSILLLLSGDSLETPDVQPIYTKECIIYPKEKENLIKSFINHQKSLGGLLK